MKLYQIENGWLGESAVRVYVIAGSDDAAKGLAVLAYKKDADEFNSKPANARCLKPASYYDPAQFTLTVLCEDTTQPWASGVSDG